MKLGGKRSQGFQTFDARFICLNCCARAAQDEVKLLSSIEATQKKWRRVLPPGTTCLCCHRWQPVVTPVPAAELLTRAWKPVCVHADKKQMSVWGVSNVKTKQTEHMWPALCWLQRLDICGDRTGPPWWSACCWARWAAGGIEKFSGAWIMDKSIMSITTS